MIDMTEADYADAYPDAEPTFAALCSRVRVYADIEVVIDDQGDLNVTQVWVVEGRDTHDYPSEAHWTFDTWREAMDAVPTFVLALSYFGMWDQVLGPLAAMGGW